MDELRYIIYSIKHNADCEYILFAIGIIHMPVSINSRLVLRLNLGLALCQIS